MLKNATQKGFKEHYFSLSEDLSEVICKTISTFNMPRKDFEQALELRQIPSCFQKASTQNENEGE